MNLLLDTHAFVWFVEGNAKLSSAARAAIEDNNNILWLSLASIWEMAIKVSVGKLTLQQPLEAFIDEQTTRNSVGLLDIDLAAVLGVADLPFCHRDPFDRLLAVTASSRQWPIVSSDAMFERYGISRVW